MKAGLATYAANQNVEQYKGTGVTMPAPSTQMKKKKGYEMACKTKKKK